MRLFKRVGLFVLTGGMALGVGLAMNNVVDSVQAATELVVYSTGFESSQEFVASTSYNNTTEKLQGPTAGQWGVIMGTASTTSPIVDAQSMQMRSYAGNYTVGRVYPKNSIANMTKVTFEAKAYNSSSTMSVEYSLNNTDWSAMTVTGTYGTTQSLITATVPSPYNGNQPSVWFRINHTLVNVASRMTIDSVSVYAMVNESKTLDAIGISGTPTKTIYYAGENFDPTGITVTAYYDDSSTSNVTLLSTYTPSPLTYGTTQVTVTFEDQEAYVSGITVLSAPTMLVLDSDFTNSGNVSWTATSFGAYFADAYGTADKDVVSKLVNTNIPLLSQSPLGTDIKVNIAVATNSTSLGIDVTVYGLDISGNRITGLSQTFTSYNQGISSAAAGIAAAEANAKFAILQTGASDRVRGIEVEFGTGARAVVSSIQVYAEEFATKELSSISITTQPTKKAYFAGEAFDPTGMVVTANYTDSSTLVVTDQVSYSTTPLTVEITSITISYTEGALTKTVDVTGITVTAVVLNSISIKTPTTDTSFTLGQLFSHSGLVINANYNSGIIEVSSGFSVTGVNTKVLGAQTATITYEDQTVTYSVNVTNNGASVGVAMEMSDLIISEYIEGASFNKAIEIFNGTGDEVDLSGYSLKLYSNGSSDVGQTLVLSGTLANNDVHVLAHGSAAADILAVTDTTNQTVINFNGDDSVALFKGETLIDLFGDITTGTDPGTSWSVPYYGSGETTATTHDKTWVRHSSISGPNSASPFASTEWLVYDVGTHSYLGSHTIEGSAVTAVEQATAFANYVMTGIGNLAEGNCVAVLAELNNEYDYMHNDSKTVFDSSSETLFVNAKARMTYLTNWVAAQSPSGNQLSGNDSNSNNIIMITIVSVIGLSTILGYYFIRKKKEA